MDSNSIFNMTSAQSCLHSFFPSIDTTFQLQLSNSPSKLAEAGFERTIESKNSTGTLDEVICKACGVKYSEWSGERPLAVHRTLSPNCSFLNTPPSSHTNTTIQKENRSNALRNVRRQLFPNYDTLESKIEDYPDIQHPFVPKRGDFLMLFESFRLLTFQDPASVEAAVFAKCGFVYDLNSLNAACIFCNQEVEYRPMKLVELEFLHERKSANCPFVKEYDVGNISCDEERQIKNKVQRKMHEKVLQRNKQSTTEYDFLVKHPEYESIECRIGTFDRWPAALCSWNFTDVVMAECGFYYTGYRDSVKCFCCSIELCHWTQGADPCSQHAKASPECFYLQKLKGEEFITVSHSLQLTVEIEFKEGDSDSAYSSDSESSLSSSPPSVSPTSSSPSQVGSPHLDLEAIKAATCQYTIQKIANAISNFFVLSNGRYPNRELLVGSLKAADQSYVQVCEQRQEMIMKDKVIEATKKEVVHSKQKETFYEKKLRATQTELARAKDTLEWTDVKLRTELEQKYRENLRQNREMLDQKDMMLEQKDEIIEHKDEMLDQKDVMLELKNREVADLQRHVQSLMAMLDTNGQQSLPTLEQATAADSDAGQVEEEFPIASCKVCLTSKAQIVFLPCKHLCCCDACAARLYGKNCPMCREKNLAMEKVYVM